MYIHLGQETVVNEKDIIGIFDLESTTISKKTRDFLEKAEKKKQVTTVSYELPKSFIVCDENKTQRIYISQISSGTLLKRTNSFKGEKK